MAAPVRTSGAKRAHGLRQSERRYPNGDVYQGDYLNDERHGKGYYQYANGDAYEGGFIKGKLHGTGQYTVDNGDSFTGTWKNDKVHGTVQYTFANGDTLSGKYSEDVPVGEVTVTLKGGPTRTFPWPDTGPKFVNEHAHAARERAWTLAGMQVAVSHTHLFFMC